MYCWPARSMARSGCKPRESARARAAGSPPCARPDRRTCRRPRRRRGELAWVHDKEPFAALGDLLHLLDVGSGQTVRHSDRRRVTLAAWERGTRPSGNGAPSGTSRGAKVASASSTAKAIASSAAPFRPAPTSASLEPAGDRLDGPSACWSRRAAPRCGLVVDHEMLADQEPGDRRRPGHQAAARGHGQRERQRAGRILAQRAQRGGHGGLVLALDELLGDDRASPVASIRRRWSSAAACGDRTSRPNRC